MVTALKCCPWLNNVSCPLLFLCSLLENFKAHLMMIFPMVWQNLHYLAHADRGLNVPNCSCIQTFREWLAPWLSQKPSQSRAWSCHNSPYSGSFHQMETFTSIQPISCSPKWTSDACMTTADPPFLLHNLSWNCTCHWIKNYSAEVNHTILVL